MTDVAVHTNGKVDPEARERLARIKRLDSLRENGWKLTLGDQWVQFRDPETLTEGNRKAFKEAGVAARMLGDRIDQAIAQGNYAAVEVLGERQAAAVLRGDYIAIAMFVESWSFELPVPNVSSLESLAQLPGPTIYDRLSEAAQDLMTVAFLDTSVSRDPDSPFADSAV